MTYSLVEIDNDQVPTVLDHAKTAVHDNATVTASGSTVITNLGQGQVSLFVNVKDSPTGTDPTIQYTLEEVDPGDDFRGNRVDHVLESVLDRHRHCAVFYRCLRNRIK